MKMNLERAGTCPKCKDQTLKEDYSKFKSDKLYCPACGYTVSRKSLMKMRRDSK